MAKKKATTKKSNVVKTREKGVRKMQKQDAARKRASKAVKRGSSTAPPPRDRNYW